MRVVNVERASKGSEVKSAYGCRQTGKTVARKILRLNFTKAAVLGLRGDLGAGKTTFLQGFAEGLGIKERILSPTFIIMRRFDIKNGSPFNSFYHFDCYRLEGKKKELSEIGFQEIIANRQNVVAIEWADKIKPFMPKEAIWINFEITGKRERKITISL